jgi:hypothetical protein
MRRGALTARGEAGGGFLFAIEARETVELEERAGGLEEKAGGLEGKAGKARKSPENPYMHDLTCISRDWLSRDWPLRPDRPIAREVGWSPMVGGSKASH